VSVTGQQDITSDVNIPVDFIAKSTPTEDDVLAEKTSQIVSIPMEDDVTARKTSQIDRTNLAGLAAGEEPDNSEDMKKAAIRDELEQMRKKDVFETISRLELENK
jgi:hypothetical protein